MLLAANYTLGKEMNEIYDFTKVNAFSEDSMSHVASFNTDNGRKIFIQNKQADDPTIRFVRRAAAERQAIFVAFNPATGLGRFAAPVTIDKVRSVDVSAGPPKGLEVSLLLRPAFLYLLANHPRFQELRSILENAKGKQQLVWVGTFPGDDEIIDVRLPPP